MSTEIELSRNSAIPSSTLPEVVLAAVEEYDYGMNLISTMAATENIANETGTVMNILRNTSSIVRNKVMVDVRDMSRMGSNNSVPSSPEEVILEVTGNDSEGVSFVVDNEQQNDNNSSSSSSGSANNNEVEEINVPIIVSPSVEEEESFAVEDTDTDDDVILVDQPIETIELLGDDDDADVQIVNSDEPIPKPKRLPQHKPPLPPQSQQQLQQQQQPHAHQSTSVSSSNTTSNNYFPALPRLPEPSVSSSLSMLTEDEHLGPILDLLDDHFGHIDFHVPTPPPILDVVSHQTESKHNRSTFSKLQVGHCYPQFTTEMAIQTDEEYKPQVKEIETQTDCSAFPSMKRKLQYLENEIDGDECPICYEPWDQSGEHSLVSLKCGHLFGDSCLRKWLNDMSAQKNLRLCPVCRSKAEIKHIRTLYARRVIQVESDPEVKRLRQELEFTRDRAKKYEMLYKREKDRNQVRMVPIPQPNAMHRAPLQNNPNMPPLITQSSLLRQPPVVTQATQLPMRTMPQVVPHLNVPTTSRGHTGNPPPFAIYPAPLVTTRARTMPISEGIIRMLFDDHAPHDFSTMTNVMTDQRTINNH